MSQPADGLPEEPRFVCFRCTKPVPVDDMSESTDNGLHLIFTGGYGEFFDAWDEDTHLILCHECAHLLAEWLELDVHNWHTHRPDSGQHDDHHDQS